MATIAPVAGAVAGAPIAGAPVAGAKNEFKEAVANGKTLTPNIPNIFKLITLISPFFIVFLLVIISIINSDIKGFVYLGGVVFLFVIAFLFQKVIPFNPKSTCSLWNVGAFQYPSFVSALYTFTITYLLFPMMTNNTFNFPLIIIFLMIYISDIIIRCTYMACSNIVNTSFGSALGVLFALFFINLLSENKDLLYYNDFVSNKQACSVPSKQKFKCSVYNNGQLVQSINPGTQ